MSKKSEDRWVNVVVVAFWVIVLGALLGFGMGIGNHNAHVSCLRLHEGTGLETKYLRSGLSGECYVNVRGNWVPEARWREIGGSS